jgi:putative transcriptional regulator|nr:MAG TPA: Repressor protein CI [Bacteriophage sp.]
MKTLGERVKARRMELGITQKELGDLVGISQNSITKIENGGNTIHIAKLASALGVSVAWLSTGKGDRDDIVENGGLDKQFVSSEPDLLHKHRIDYYDVRAAAGITGFENSDYPEIISSLYLTDEGMAQLVGKKSSDGICLVNVPTDSMEPTIRKGDIVFLDTKVNAYSGDGIYAFAIDGALFIKRIQKMIGGGYRMISDNEIYPPEQISDDVCKNAQFIGRFIRTIHIEAVNL